MDDAMMDMDIHPTTNITKDIHFENLKILPTGCGNPTSYIVFEDMYNTIFFSKRNTVGMELKVTNSRNLP